MGNRLFLVITTLAVTDACDMIRMSRPLECQEIKNILRYHNEKRNEVALNKTKLSGAKNMWKLKWSDDLEKLASDYANNCDFQHNKDRPRDVGENLAWKKSYRDEVGEFRQMASGWYDEIQYYDSSKNHNGTVGHFTQMIWGDTKFIGCGISFYKDTEGDPEKPYNTLLVCNYKPSGNIKGEEPYFTDDGSTRCDNRLVDQIFRGLCAHDETHMKALYTPCKRDKRVAMRRGTAATCTDTSYIVPTLVINCAVALYRAILK